MEEDLPRYNFRRILSANLSEIITMIRPRLDQGILKELFYIGLRTLNMLIPKKITKSFLRANLIIRTTQKHYMNTLWLIKCIGNMILFGWLAILRHCGY